MTRPSALQWTGESPPEDTPLPGEGQVTLKPAGCWEASLVSNLLTNGDLFCVAYTQGSFFPLSV